MRRIAGLVVLVTLLASACSSGDDGDASDEGGAGVTTTSAPAALTLTSPAFEDGGVIPDEHAACVDRAEGPDISLPLAWSGVPDEAESLAITMVDPDAGGFVHWVVTGIAPVDDEVAAGEDPAGAVDGRNDTGETGYFGPCPPEAHTYVVALHALGSDPGVTPSTSGPDAVAAIEAAAIATAELRGTYDQDG